MIRVPVAERPAELQPNAHTERVRFGDTDAAGIVYYATYLRWFEAGRGELMRAAGIPYHSLVGDDLIMPVVEAWARYRSPARYDDLLRVESWVHELRAATVVVAHQIWCDERLIAEGGARLACMSRDGHPRRLPDRLRALRGVEA